MPSPSIINNILFNVAALTDVRTGPALYYGHYASHDASAANIQSILLHVLSPELDFTILQQQFPHTTKNL
jgi:hypothetical protein